MEPSKKVCIITGATNGLGRAAAGQLARIGFRLVLVGRSEERGAETVAEIRAQSGNEDVNFLRADLSSVAEVRRLAADLRSRLDRLDVLVNNAGAIFMRREITSEGLERTFALNHLAYFVLTGELLELLKASAPARIINVSSGAHRVGHIHFEDLDLSRRYSSFRAYAQSKLANVLHTNELARRLKRSGVTANSLHPGFVASGFARNNGAFAQAVLWLLSPFSRSPERCAGTLVHLATSPQVEGVSGKYFYKSRLAKTSREACDPVVAHRLWEESMRMVEETAGKVSFP